MVGESTREFTHQVDARWLTAYATGIGDKNPRYQESTEGPVMAHPIFPVSLEWPVILASRQLPGYDALNQAQVVSLQAIRPGAAVVTRIDTRNNRDELVCQTWHLAICRGVTIEGEPGVFEAPPAPPDLVGAEPQQRTFEIPVVEGLSTTYTETARISSPIHTDTAYAKAAGLPDIILHGTATLALGVTALVKAFAEGDPTRVERIGGRFSGFVLMPNTLTLEVTARAGSTYGFRLLERGGAEVFSAGYITFKT
jgi:acyl dehydratase